MNHLVKRTANITLLTLAIGATLPMSDANAEIYKWRDNRGVVQYSDKPPVTNYSKATQHEILNALQQKELCAVPSKATVSKAARNFSANFFGSATGKTTTLSLAGNGPSSSLSGAVINQYSPLSAAAKITVAGSPVTVFNSPVKPTTTSAGSALTGTAPSTGTTAGSTSTTTNTSSTSSGTTTAATGGTSSTAATSTSSGVTTPTASTAATTTSAATATTSIVQVALMPAVDIGQNILAAAGFSTVRIKSSTLSTPATGGAFRIVCTPSHMNNDDPVVYPNQKGAAHHHTFFGNTSVDFKSDLMNFANVGNSTCRGGIANRSAYWVPSMIDTATKKPITAETAIFYYKTGRTPPSLIKAPPKGLRMISGESKATSAETSKANFTCIPPSGSNKPFYGWHKTIPNCAPGETMQMHVAFPHCWDGKNLDSPDHKSHMAFTNRLLTTANKCPTSHPIALPQVTVNFNYYIPKANHTVNWRLASDNYSNSLAGGYSSHADWVNGWDDKIMAGIVKNCLNRGVDCHAHLLGDGRTLY